MGKKSPKEQRLRWVINSQLRSADQQVRNWLRSEGKDSDGRRNAVFERFLNAMHEYYFNNKLRRKRILELYNDPSFNALGSHNADGGFYSSTVWRNLRQRVLSEYGDVCMRCGSKEFIAVDHILPRSKFPDRELDYSNLQVLCRKCNSRKSNRCTKDYRHYTGRIPQTESDHARTLRRQPTPPT